VALAGPEHWREEVPRPQYLTLISRSGTGCLRSRMAYGIPDYGRSQPLTCGPYPRLTPTHTARPIVEPNVAKR
jgi:hypothetical protein